ncbi:MAG: ATP-binding protein [Synergistes sp.]|nr:ATP-binding protein [Synergistes sp.]
MNKKKFSPVPGMLTVYRDLERDEVFSGMEAVIMRDLAGLTEESRDEAAEIYCGCVSEMADAAEKLGISGNIWCTWLAALIARSENAFALSHERRKLGKCTMHQLAAADLNILYHYINYDFRALEKRLGIDMHGCMPDFIPSAEKEENASVKALANDLAAARCTDDLLKAAEKFYEVYGCGAFALNAGFRWDSHERRIVPAVPLENIMLYDIIGCEDQKNIITENTEAFLAGLPANNVLLYGDGGTGKSSTIKAVLNEYAWRGLRMIEVYKHQISDLETILEAVKRRNYKFVLFMDDLSFEPSEVEYKFLKAFIEGGLEKRPDNVLIYATSNRRHIIKETWGDRADKDDDMHESETMQEKMSLVDRFGILVRYMSPEQKEYLHIARTLAGEYGVEADSEEFELGAIRWELKHGGFSGRSAKQYVEYLAGQKKAQNKTKNK